jgi:protein-disulfide isomerase
MLLRRRGADCGVSASWLPLAARLVLGSALIAAGLANLGDPIRAAEAVQAYQILPASLASMVGYGQSALPLTLGILLVVGLASRLVGVLQGLLLIVYIGGIVSVWARGLSIDCGCFGGGGPVAVGHTQYPLDILRDIALLALAAIVVTWAPGRFAVDRLLGVMPQHPGDLAPDESHTAEPVEAGPGGAAPHRGPSERLIGAGVLVLVLVLAAAGTVAQRDRAAAESTAYPGPYAPATMTAGNTVTMAQPGVTKPVLVIYEDFQCSVCDEFELANGGLIERLAYLGRVKVVYHLFTIFVGSQPRQANSTRAWAAAKCVPAHSWVGYHDLLYVHQPSETMQNGFPVTQLLALGRLSGLTGSAFTQCVTSQRYAAQLVRISNGISRRGINATPTVTLDGRQISLSTLVLVNGTLSQMITARH